MRINPLCGLRRWLSLNPSRSGMAGILDTARYRTFFQWSWRIVRDAALSGGMAIRWCRCPFNGGRCSNCIGSDKIDASWIARAM
jgi:hypothetical protein